MCIFQTFLYFVSYARAFSLSCTSYKRSFHTIIPSALANAILGTCMSTVKNLINAISIMFDLTFEISWE
ncbi:hypothetical protein FB480_103549 [Agrobacterium vitis]|nr:hypothetical protein FB480_103549 [Agrobacterium vitis]